MLMSSLSQEDNRLLQQLNRQPNLKKRIQSILSIAEDDGEGIVKADEAEGRIIEEVRRLGNETLTEWAVSRVEKSEAYLPADDNISRSGQKKYIGTVPSERYMCLNRSTDNRENGTDHSVKMPG
jgi:hypothetical protein